ncbi:MAG: condensation domain-containing protein [Cyanobacteria bacterium J06627_28]
MDSVFVAPQTGVEKLLAKLWQQVLKVDKIGIHDNFFDLGGDSIMAIQIAARLAESGFALSPNDIFQHPTLAELVGVVAPEEGATSEIVAGEVPLTPIQRAFFELEPSEPDQFTQTVLLNVDGQLDADALREAVRSLVAYHDSLRLSYQQTASGWVQRYQTSVDAAQFSIVPLLGSESPQQQVKETLEQRQKQLNIAEGDLVRAVLFELGGQQQLGMVVHHLVVDAVSWQTLVRDLETAYGQLLAGEDVLLPPKTSSFKGWAEGLQSVDISAEEVAYWENAVISCGEATTPLNHRVSLNESREDIQFKVGDGQRFARYLDAEMTRLFFQDSDRYRPQEKLLAAISEAISGAISGQGKQEKILFNLESHGREEAFVPGMRLVRTVGWFTALFPVVVCCEQESAETLRSVKQTLREIPQNGIGYGVLRYLQPEKASEMISNQSTAEVLFNYLGDLEQLLPSQSMFRMARPLQVSRSEQMKRTHLIDISAYLMDGQLQIDWDCAGVDESTVQTMADETMRQLKQLMDAPTDGPAAEDFPLANLNSQKLDKLSSLLGTLDGLEGAL